MTVPTSLTNSPLGLATRGDEKSSYIIGERSERREFSYICPAGRHRTSSNCACSSITRFFLSERDFICCLNQAESEETQHDRLEHLRSYRGLLHSPVRDFSTLPLVPYSCKTNQIAGLCLIRAVV